MIFPIINVVSAEQVVISIVPGASTAAEISDNAPMAQTSQVFEPYSPSSWVEIMPNTTVIWFNNDTVPHTIKAGSPDEGDGPSGLFDSGIIDQGMRWNHTFTDRGTYRYFDTIYPQMEGKVVVNENINRSNFIGNNNSMSENLNLSNFTRAMKSIN